MKVQNTLFTFGTILFLVCLLLCLEVTQSRPQTQRHHHHQHHHQLERRHYQNANDASGTNSNNNNIYKDNNNGQDETRGGSGRGGRMAKSSWRRSSVSNRDDEYDYEEDRHAYLMTPNNIHVEAREEDEAITSAFEKHMSPVSSQHSSNHHHHHQHNAAAASSEGGSKDTAQVPPEHDVYAYQLPSNLWFIVRYKLVKTPNGQEVQKYMNIVDSFTDYLDKLEKGVRTVSVNVKGVETVFSLTEKHPYHQPSSLSSSSSSGGDSDEEEEGDVVSSSES